MTPRIGYFLSCEEYTPAELVSQAVMAREAGFDALWISDHFHPWNAEQGQSPFVWSVIGALSQATNLPVTTAVTCPTTRVHPAVVAQAAATSQVMLDGRFTLGIGTGEALNEHILGDRWPCENERLEQLEEAVYVMRRLWSGRVVNHHGKHYTVEQARIYTCPPEPPRIFMSAFGPKAASVAGRIADGFITTGPDRPTIDCFRTAGGEGKPMMAGYKVCWGSDANACLEIAHRLWSTSGLPGELSQTLTTPEHFEQARQLVTKAMTAKATTLGDDPQAHVDAFAPYRDAGFDEVYISQIGATDPRTSAEGFFEFYATKVLPALRN